jgi:hypothetical protein
MKRKRSAFIYFWYQTYTGQVCSSSNNWKLNHFIIFWEQDNQNDLKNCNQNRLRSPMPNTVVSNHVNSPPVVCRRARVLFTLFVFVCIKWCLTHIVVCVCVVCLRLCYQFLWIVLFWLPLRCSLTSIKLICSTFRHEPSYKQLGAKTNQTSFFFIVDRNTSLPKQW